MSMRTFALLVGALVCASCATVSPEVSDLVVTFDRSTSTAEARDLVRQLDPEAKSEGVFEPVRLSARLDAPPSAEAVAGLFEGGAISVEAIRAAAQLAEVAFTTEEIGRLNPQADVRSVASLEAIGLGGYSLRVTYPSTLPSRVAADRFEASVGVPPEGVEVVANDLRVTAAASDLATRLRTAPGVLAVRADA